jgi:hypothetical protein
MGSGGSKESGFDREGGAMTSIDLNQAKDAINIAMIFGPGVKNQNYIAAHNAISAQITANGGFNPGAANTDDPRLCSWRLPPSLRPVSDWRRW